MLQKTLLSLSFIVTLFFSSTAQIERVYIVYENGKNSNPSITAGNVVKQIDQINFKFELWYNNSVSVFKNIPNTADENKYESNGGFLSFKVDNSIREHYLDFSKNIRLFNKDLGTKSYVVEAPINNFDWKLTDETKEIGGFRCRKAIGMAEIKTWSTSASDIKREVIVKQHSTMKTFHAWFTESIPVAIGPEFFCGLPGAILEISTDKGSVIYTATNITINGKEKKISMTTTGKKIPENEFYKLEQKYREDKAKAENGY